MNQSRIRGRSVCVFLSYLREGIEGSLEGSVGEELKT